MSKWCVSWQSWIPPSARPSDLAEGEMPRECGLLGSWGAANPPVLVSGHLLEPQKNSGVLAAALDQALRPALVGAEQVHRGHHVEEHALCEEVRDAIRRQPGSSLDVLHELAVATPHERPDVW